MCEHRRLKGSIPIFMRQHVIRRKKSLTQNFMLAIIVLIFNL